jgi:plastocyanin
LRLARYESAQLRTVRLRQVSELRGRITRPEADEPPALDTGETLFYTFDKPATYKYFCIIHPRMQGTVVVQ